ncbi:hypothetical protein [Palleronia pelagia]|uniref:Lipopolysaccharide export system protein LptA n=1 Tax=Palleronia pelagia TaxID=387096 RepID=A0A1H8FNI3_9RHOB|nr:hypothetical protein [Palleronia pelagia]SEN33256.1 hypothetical protein SAMN04488011_103406 [Palleronia pelagia]
MFRSALLLSATLAAPAVAQTAGDATTIGSLDGTLDGVQVAYVIVDGEDRPTGWTETDTGIELTLRAYPADGPQGEDDSLTITVTADPSSRQGEMQSGEVTLTRNGDTLTATDEAIDLTVNSLEVTGDSLLIEGNIRATMGPGDADLSVVSDEGVTLSADLQATVIRSE